jgi:hypothetical protein
MRTLISAAFLPALILFTGVNYAPAQAALASTETTVKSAAIIEHPFAVGEVLTYEAKVNKILRGIGVADLTFSITDPPGADSMLITADARSKGTLLKLFRYSFIQKYDTLVDPTQFRALKTHRHDEQKDRVRDGEALFDYGERRVTYTEVDPREPTRPPRRIASQIENKTQDLVSGVYALRLLPLAVGKTFSLTVSDSGLVYEIPVRVTARETQNTVIGKVFCFKVEPQVFGQGRLIEKEGNMTIWITDDDKRIPVRSQINSSFGKIEIRLRSATGSK